MVLALENIGFRSNLLLEQITTSLQARALWICLTYRFMEESMYPPINVLEEATSLHPIYSG